jgi:hypothetical protein
MHQGRALIWVLLAGLLVGCASGAPERSTSWLGRFRSFQLPAGPDVIQMEVVLLERPIGDPYINQEVWQLADEQIVPLERKALLGENGLRVGQLGGQMPVGLLSLLTSERSCVNPRRHYIHAGKPRLFALGPACALCQFQTQLEGETMPFTLDQAQCNLSVVPVLGDKGQVRLQFTPQIDYGETRFAAQPAEDNSGFILQPKRSTKSFPALSWEVSLAANQYLLVGARADRFDSLGYQCFVRHDETNQVQRLLVIRAWRAVPAGANEASSWSDDEDSVPGRAPPLALQAAWSAARGSAE